MKNLKVLLVVGTRPQFVKTSVLLDAFTQAAVNTALVHTGQHYDTRLSQALFEELHIRLPDYNLGTGSGSYKFQIQEGVLALKEIIVKEQPTHVVTIGDSSPALVGCLGALTQKVPLIHIEAGLRSGNALEPEERNRIIIDSLADHLFCSTRECLENLRRENMGTSVFLTGDLLCDAWKKHATSIRPAALKNFVSRDYCLLTLHRQSNVYHTSQLERLIKFLRANRCMPMVWPVHPGVRKKLVETGLFDKLVGNPYIILLPPATYLEMKWLLQNSSLVVTDSVGVQVEAYLARKISVVLRKETEYNDLIQMGWSKRVDPTEANFHEYLKVIESSCSLLPVDYDESLFGDGHSAGKMADALCNL
jgi:UDP-N-acetylglucosamine 2-epimerase